MNNDKAVVKKESEFMVGKTIEGLDKLSANFYGALILEARRNDWKVVE